MFLDTPHSGADTAMWEAVYGGTATEAAKEQFGTWSIRLAEMVKSFDDIASRVNITSVHAQMSVLFAGKTFEVWDVI
jgi:hypothetical protein